MPFDTGSYGYVATVSPGAPFTPLLTSADGNVAGRGVPASGRTDPQAGVAELALTFDYNAEPYCTGCCWRRG